MKKMKLFVSMMAIAFMLVVPVAVGAQFGLDEADFDDTLQGGGEGVDLKDTINDVMMWLFGFLGLLAVFIVLWGGFKWMTAGGDEDKVGEAKNILKAGVIGLIIILSSYMIASFVFGEVGGFLENSGA